MKILNKIVLTFIFAIVFFLTLVWQYLHTENFASLVSNRVSIISEKYLGVEIKFKQLDLELYPPGVGAKKISLNLNNKLAHNLDLDVESFIVYFNIFDVFAGKVSTDRILIDQGEIKLSKVDTEAEPILSAKNENIDAEMIREKVESTLDVIDKLPFKLGELDIRNVSIEYDSLPFYVNSLRSKITGDQIELNLAVSNFSKFKDYPTADYVEGHISVTKEKVLVNNLRLFSYENYVTLNGLLNLDKDLSFNVNSKIDLNLNGIENAIRIAEYGKFYNGHLQAEVSTTGNKSGFVSKGPVRVLNLNSDYVIADEVKTELTFVMDKFISLTNTKVSHKGGDVLVPDVFRVYEFKSKKVLPDKINFSMNDFPIESALTYIKDTMYPLSARMNGAGEFNFFNNRDFTIKTNRDVLIRDLVVKFDNEFIRAANFKLHPAIFELRDFDFYMKFSAGINRTFINTEGQINSESLAIVVSDSVIEFNDFNTFAGQKVTGLANVNLTFKGVAGKNVMDGKVAYNDLNAEGFYIGSGETTISMNFETGVFETLGMNGKVGSSLYKANVILDAYNSKLLELNNSFENAQVRDLYLFHYPALKSLDSYVDNISGSIDYKYRLSGEFDVSKLVLESEMNVDNLVAFDETFNSANFVINFKNSIVNFDKIILRKGGQRLIGSYSYNLIKDSQLLKVSTSGINLSSLNIYNQFPGHFDAKLRFDLDLFYSQDNFDINFSSVLVDSQIRSTRVEDSTLDIKFRNGHIETKSSVIGQNILIDCSVDMNSVKTSQCKAIADINQMNLLLSGLLGAAVDGQDFEGNLAAKLSSSFKYNEIDKLNLEGQVTKAFLTREDVSINLKEPIKLKIDKGEISPLFTQITGENININLIARGNLSNSFELSSYGNFKSTILHLISTRIIKVDGFIDYKLSLSNKTNFEPVLDIKSSNLELIVDGMPVNLKSTDLNIKLTPQELRFEKFDATLDSGSLGLEGHIELKWPTPELFLTYNLNQAKINVLDFASTYVSGLGTLTGKKMPYYLGGSLYINRAIVKDIPSNLSSGKNLNKNPYLPIRSNQLDNSLLRLNVSMKTLNPIRVINSLADISLSGDMLFTGTTQNPRARGIIRVLPGQSRVYFKNNEFVVSRGEISFSPDNQISNPDLDILSQTSINDYSINVRVYNNLENFQLELSSDPPLAQQDILSLIAFGYTDDMSRQLSDVDRESLGSAGVGSFLFDQLQIGRKLKQSFGVQLNLGTQFVQQNSSYLNNNSSNTTGRVRSATKVELRKQLNDQMQLSVSSTVGGSIGQRQSMNLNYNLSEKVSVEGVYQLRTNEEGEEDVIDKSIGADVKFKWQF